MPLYYIIVQFSFSQCATKSIGGLVTVWEVLLAKVLACSYDQSHLLLLLLFVDLGMSILARSKL